MAVVGKTGKSKTMLYKQLSDLTEISRDCPDIYGRQESELLPVRLYTLFKKNDWFNLINSTVIKPC